VFDFSRFMFTSARWVIQLRGQSGLQLDVAVLVTSVDKVGNFRREDLDGGLT
jgi:hypothetical protein